MNPTRAFHAMAKPCGPACNLSCLYCFYQEKEAFTPPGRMSPETLEAYVRGYIESVEPGTEVAFTWQGGEPTLVGLDFYRRAVELQKRYGRGRSLTNSFQTNGVLLDAAWCDFLAEHDFLVGLSLDGPADLHDPFRPAAGGKPSHGLAMRALELMRKRGVRHNILACVNRRTSEEPLRVYEFLRGAGAEFIQFIPIVERKPGAAETALGLRLGAPEGRTVPAEDDPEAAVTDWSVRPEAYGRFLTDIFDVWVRRDVGQSFVMNFEWALANFLGRPGTVCHHQPTCGRSMAVEQNGDVYACDHYVYPEYRLGNLKELTLADMADSPAQEEFGRSKHSALAERCLSCPVLRGCWGGCPKHRFAAVPGDRPVNYLCRGFRHFFAHLGPYLKALGDVLAAGRPASDIMGAKLIFLNRPPGGS